MSERDGKEGVRGGGDMRERERRYIKGGKARREEGGLRGRGAIVN